MTSFVGLDSSDVSFMEQYDLTDCFFYSFFLLRLNLYAIANIEAISTYHPGTRNEVISDDNIGRESKI